MLTAYVLDTPAPVWLPAASADQSSVQLLRLMLLCGQLTTRSRIVC